MLTWLFQTLYYFQTISWGSSRAGKNFEIQFPRGPVHLSFQLPPLKYYSPNRHPMNMSKVCLNFIATSRCSVSWGTVWETARKKKSNVRGSERTPVSKLNKRSFLYTRIWYTLWLVISDRFCQHSSITDADEMYYMSAIRHLSMSDAMFKSVMNNTLN